MKKIFTLLMICALTLLTGCGGGSQENSPPKPQENKADAPASAKTPDGKKILVVYFSRTGEEYNVGNITKGNTAIVAEYIAQKVGADTFEIKPAKPYPNEYQACTELAKTELEANTRPALANKIDNLAQYDTIFIGYPIWWSAVPRVLLTFLESGDFSGKTIIPFCTHGGSGLAVTEREISEACPNAKVLSGLAISGKAAQTDFAAAQKDIDAWLKNLGY